MPYMPTDTFGTYVWLPSAKTCVLVCVLISFWTFGSQEVQMQAGKRVKARRSGNKVRGGGDDRQAIVTI